MILTELTLSACTLFSMWMITNHKRGGILLGFFLQCCWVCLWVFVTKQFGFVLLDLGICVVFADRMFRDFRKWDRFVDDKIS
jgi:hypothetical protein